MIGSSCTALAVLLAVSAVVLGLPAPVAVRLRSDAPTPRRSHRRRRPLLVALVAAAPAVVAAGALLGGAEAGVLAGAVGLVVGTVLRLLQLRGRHRSALTTHGAVVEACNVLAANLRVGMVPAQALASAAAGCPVLWEAHETMVLGGDVTEAWRRQAHHDGADGLRALARAWQVAHRSGASLTATLDQVAAEQSADQSLRAVVGSELAAPRATGKLMAALPVLGIGMGYLLGGDPVRWLTDAVPGWTCLVLGVALACAGVLWIEALARRAAVEA